MSEDNLSREQALIYAMIVMAASDRTMSDVELRRIGQMVRELPPFVDFDETRLVAEAQACGKVMSAPGGLNRVLDAIANALPGHLRETAYVLCCEVAVADREMGPEERRFLQLLASRLMIDPLIASALERGARARHQRARPEDA
ncbi:MAG: tellurite resistance TerB family protein [Pseudomonadota bacterium]